MESNNKNENNTGKEENEDVKPDEITLELYLLIYKFLQSSGFETVAETFGKEITKKTILHMRTDYEGEIHPMSLGQMIYQCKNVKGSHLLDALIETINILRAHPSGQYYGLSSLISKKFPSKQKNVKILFSINPFSPYTDAMTSLIKRSYPVPNRIRKDILNEKMLCSISLQKRILGHLASTYCVIFDKTGESIITGSDDNLIKIWKSRTGSLVATLRGHTAEICDLAISSDNSILASCSCDKTVRLWSTHSSAELYVLQGHTSSVTSIKFSPYTFEASNYLISTGSDANICFWLSINGKFDNKPTIFCEKIKNNSQLVCSSFSPGGNLVAIGSSDSRIYIYRVENIVTKIADIDGHNDRVDTVEFNHFGDKFLTASGDGVGRIWYPRSSSTWSSTSLSLSFSQDSEEESHWSSKSKILNLTWNLDDCFVIGSLRDHSIVIWCSNNGNIIRSLHKHTDSIFVIESHPFLKNIFMSAGHDGMIVLWDIYSPDPLNVLVNKIQDHGTGAIFDAKLSPREYIIAATDSNGHLCIFGYGTSDTYSHVPSQQFFHTDYRPIYSEDNITYDEQTGMLPHMMFPPYIVNMDGDPHPSRYQLIHLGRVKRSAPQNIVKKDLTDQVPDNQAARAIGLLSVGDVEGVRQTENIHFSIPITSEDIKKWKKREIVRALTEPEMNEILFQNNILHGLEFDFYKNIHQSCDIQQLNNDERKSKLMSLKSKILRNKIVDSEIECITQTPHEQFVDVSIFPNIQNTISIISSEEPSYHTGSEDLESSDLEYSDDSAISNTVAVKREICTRRNRYILQKEGHEIETTMSSLSTISQDSSSQAIFPSIPTMFGISRNWILGEKPSRSPYFPQFGDIVVYLLQAHKTYVNYVINNHIFHIQLSKLCYNKMSLRCAEICRVSGINFITGYPYICSLTLTKMDASGTYSTGVNFNVQFTDIQNLDDFVILKQFFDSSLRLNWNVGDEFRSYVDDKWWNGTIIDMQPLSQNYSDCHFHSFSVVWNTGESDLLSPWDIFPIEEENIDFDYNPEECDWAPEYSLESKLRIMAGFETIELMPQFSEIENTLNTNEDDPISLPTSLCKIYRKCANGFYRRKKSIIWELRLILHNASIIKPSQYVYKNIEIFSKSLISFIKDVSFDLMGLISEHTQNITNIEESCSDLSNSVSDPSLPDESKIIHVPSELKWVLKARTFLEYITNLSDAQPFLRPVDIKAYSDYLLFINRPIDFTIISQKLLSGNYLSPDQFVSDMKLVLSNSRLYNTNPRSSIYGMTLRLSNLFKKKIEQFLPGWRKQSLRGNSHITRNKVNSLIHYLDNSSKNSLSQIDFSVIKSPAELPESTPIATRLRKRKHTNLSSKSSFESSDNYPEIKIRRQPARYCSFNATPLPLRHSNKRKHRAQTDINNKIKRRKIKTIEHEQKIEEISMTTSADSINEFEDSRGKRYNLRSSIPISTARPKKIHTRKLRKRKPAYYYED